MDDKKEQIVSYYPFAFLLKSNHAAAYNRGDIINQSVRHRHKKQANQKARWCRNPPILSLNISYKYCNDYYLNYFKVCLYNSCVSTESKTDWQKECYHQPTVCYISCFQWYIPFSNNLFDATLDNIISLTAGFKFR